MDTLGLNTFQLPDIQCHFVGLNPSDVATFLFNTAKYIFDEGDVIENGDTIEGIEKGQEWVCGHEESLVGPERIVLDINPGGNFSPAR